MILAGTLDGAPEPVRVRLTADVSQFTDAMIRAKLDVEAFERHLVRTARNMLTLDALLEVLGMSVDQVWATYYTRGAFHPDFAATPEGEASRDHYLRALLDLKGERGRAAVEAFLRGWFTHRPGAVPTDGEGKPLAWHRLIGDTAIFVSPDRVVFVEQPWLRRAA